MKVTIFCGLGVLASMLLPAAGRCQSTSMLTTSKIRTQAQTISSAQLKALADAKSNPTDWIGGSLWAGVSEFSLVSQRDLEAKSVRSMGDTAKWLMRNPNDTNADDDCIGQAYLDVYANERDPATIAALRPDMDRLVVQLNASASDPTKLLWWWCDALFMAPPVLTRLSNLTGDPKYLNAMDVEWQKTSKALYDPTEYLFFRDARFVTTSGKKVFWSRGNGWVFAGLCRVLTSMPRTFPNRARYETQFQQMAGKLLRLQGSDGLWRTDLLDPTAYPAPESSGSAFFCYGFAWGVNNGLLDRAQYGRASMRAWKGLIGLCRPDGLPGSVQAVGYQPGPFKATDTQLYATGAMLLAATELMKLNRSGVTTYLQP